MQASNGPLVDTSSYAEALPDTETRAWAADKRVFISSVIKGLEEERSAATSAIRSVGAQPVSFETFGGRDEAAEVAYLAEVASSDIYVGILGAAYGGLLPSGRSATHDEYVEAEARGLRISVWADAGASLEPSQAELLAAIRTMHTTGSFKSPAELTAGLVSRLTEMAAEDLSPWLKLGPVVFRARRVDESARLAHIAARVRDDDVTEALRQLGGGLPALGSGGQLLTVSGRTRAVIVKDVATSRVAGLTTTVEVDLEIRGAPNNTTPKPTFGVGGKTYSPMDLCGLAIRRALGQTDVDIDATAMMTSIGNPLGALPSLRLGAGSMSAVAGLLLTEALVANGLAGRITRFRMGPVANQRRLVDVAWEDIARYTGVSPERRSLQTEMEWRA
jgi:hypothetical protein